MSETLATRRGKWGVAPGVGVTYGVAGRVGYSAGTHTLTGMLYDAPRKVIGSSPPTFISSRDTPELSAARKPG